MNKTNDDGQIQVGGMLIVFILLVMLVALLPALTEVIAIGQAALTDPMAILLLSFFPLALLIALMGTLFIFMQRPQA